MIEPADSRRVAPDGVFEHALKNQLAIILGYADLLVAEMSPDDPRRGDLLEIHKAATAALALFDRHQSATA